jgi:mxaD protein
MGGDNFLHKEFRNMKIKKAILIGVSILAGSYAMAAAPVLHVTKTLTFDASASKVWTAVKDFNGLATWHPALASDEIVEGTNNTVGAVRVLALKGGGTIKENRSFKYTILESVLPVSDYTSTFAVKSLGKGKSSITWSGRFKRKDVGDNPSDKENDKTAVDTITGVYQGGLDNLKKMVEAK